MDQENNLVNGLHSVLLLWVLLSNFNPFCHDESQWIDNLLPFHPRMWCSLFQCDKIMKKFEGF